MYPTNFTLPIQDQSINAIQVHIVQRGMLRLNDADSPAMDRLCPDYLYQNLLDQFGETTGTTHRLPQLALHYTICDENSDMTQEIRWYGCLGGLRRCYPLHPYLSPRHHSELYYEEMTL